MTVMLEWGGVTVPVQFKDGEPQMYNTYCALTDEVCKLKGLSAVFAEGRYEGPDASQAASLGADIIHLARPSGGSAEERDIVLQAIDDIRQTLILQNVEVASVTRGKITTWKELTDESLKKVVASSPGTRTAAFAMREMARRQGKLISA